MTVPTILITGVSRGLGEALGKLVLTQGWRLIAIGRGASPGWIVAAPQAALFIQADMTKLDEVHTAIASIVEPIDVVVNSAAVFGGEAYFARHFDPAALEEVFRVNVVAPAIIARDIKAKLRETGPRLVVMMSTGNASLEGNSGGEMFAYRASKSALNQVARTMAAEWQAENIKVIALNPGWVRTDMGGEAAPLSPDEGAADVLNFITAIAESTATGSFVNTDGSALPW